MLFFVSSGPYSCHLAEFNCIPSYSSVSSPLSPSSINASFIHVASVTLPLPYNPYFTSILSSRSSIPSSLSKRGEKKEGIKKNSKLVCQVLKALHNVKSAYFLTLTFQLSTSHTTYKSIPTSSLPPLPVFSAFAHFAVSSTWNVLYSSAYIQSLVVS